jgi:hypothetical protein
LNFLAANVFRDAVHSRHWHLSRIQSSLGLRVSHFANVGHWISFLFRRQLNFLADNVLFTAHPFYRWYLNPIHTSLRLRLMHLPSVSHWKPFAFHLPSWSSWWW